MVDGVRRAEAEIARDVAVVDAADDTGADPDDLERAWDREHPMPGQDLIACHLADGHVRWRLPMGGDVTSVAADATAVHAVVEDAAGRAHLHSVDVTTPIPRPAAPIPLGGATLAALDDARVLVATPDELLCLSSGTVLWRLALPESVRCPYRDYSGGTVRATVDFRNRTKVIFRNFTVRDLCPGDNFPTKGRIWWKHTDGTTGYGAWGWDRNGCGDDGTNFGNLTRTGTKAISSVYVQVCSADWCDHSAARFNQYVHPGR
ncbi:hypothetical protein ACIBQX_50500 [Nonomuraea sp. NPDC049714]|uniref:hypothetical protein n=1 Tax=Nonomuraea sp. NPDC049714 TaxID=3364357 RepID=UPI00378800A7